MNQRDLARALSKKFFLPQRQSARLLHFIVEKTAEALRRGERFTLQEFGVFRRVRRAAKKVRHPKTGKTLTIPERFTADFRPSPFLAKRLNSFSHSPTEIRRSRTRSKAPKIFPKG